MDDNESNAISELLVYLENVSIPLADHHDLPWAKTNDVASGSGFLR